MTLHEAKQAARAAGFTHLLTGQQTRKSLESFRHSKAHLYRWTFVPADKPDGPAIDFDDYRFSRTYPLQTI